MWMGRDFERYSYNEISAFFHNYSEPVFITKNGKGDLSVMSIDAYEQLAGRFELYGLIHEGLEDAAAGRTRPFSEAMADIRSRRRSSYTVSENEKQNPLF